MVETATPMAETIYLISWLRPEVSWLRPANWSHGRDQKIRRTVDTNMLNSLTMAETIYPISWLMVETAGPIAETI